MALHTYTEVKMVTMANRTQLKAVEFYPPPKLEDITHADGSLDLDGIIHTKEAALKRSSEAGVAGYGEFAGRSLRELPRPVKLQIKRLMAKTEVAASHEVGAAA